MGLCLKPCLKWALFWPPVVNVDYTPDNLRAIYGLNFTILTTPHGSQIPFVLCKKENEEPVNARPCVLFSHGNAEDLYNTLKFCNLIQRMCRVNVAAYDYTGYGIATGRPSESNVYNDVLTVYDHLTKTVGVHPGNVILWGRSLGSGPTVHLASKIPVRGMVLHSPLLSALRTQSLCCLCAKCPCLCCYPDAFPNIDKTSTIECPVFIIHGTKDAVVPFWHGETLHKRLKRSRDPLWVEGAGHNDILKQAKQAYMDRAKDFISYLYTLRFDGKNFSPFYEGQQPDGRLYLFGGNPRQDLKSPTSNSMSQIGSVIHGPASMEYALYQSQVSPYAKEEEADETPGHHAGSPGLTTTSSFSYSTSYTIPPPPMFYNEEKNLSTSSSTTSMVKIPSSKSNSVTSSSAHASSLPLSLPPSPSRYQVLSGSSSGSSSSGSHRETSINNTSTTTPLLRDSSSNRYLATS